MDPLADLVDPVAGVDVRPEPSDTFEVGTTTADTLRASIEVTGTLSDQTCRLLASVLRTHLCAGRRYLRVDLSAAGVPAAHAAAVAAVLTPVHDEVDSLGGVLLLTGAAPVLVRTDGAAALFARSAG